jgi:hypothetical protein
MDRAASDAPRATAALRNSGFVPVLEPQYTQTDANGPELCGDNSARGEPAVVAIEAVMTVGFGYPPSSRPSPRERSARPRLAAIGEKVLEFVSGRRKQAKTTSQESQALKFLRMSSI